MTTDTLKSLSITNLDASPVVANTAGSGAAGRNKVYDDYVTPTAGGLGSTSSKYKMVRVPFTCQVKEVVLIADAILDTNNALTVDVGAYYSDSTVDGTPAASTGTAISTSCFIANTAFAQTAATQKISSDGTWSAVNQAKQLWDALGLTGPGVSGSYGEGPGGFCDIVVGVHTAASTASAHNFKARVSTVQE